MQRSDPLGTARGLDDPGAPPAHWAERPEFANPPIFINDLEFTCELSDDGSIMEGEVHAVPAVRAGTAGWIRPSVLATVADVMAGIQANHIIGGRLPLTVDIDVRTTAPMGEWVGATSRLLKVGRSTIGAEVTFEDVASGQLAALSYLTFTPSPRPQDVAPSLTTATTTGGTMRRPFPEHVGVRVIAPGTVEIDHHPYVLQASNTLQGGIVALLGEYAAESLTRRPVLDLDTRYLAAVRVGPARATAAVIGADQVRVEIRDPGNGNRLTARTMARLGHDGGPAATPVTVTREEQP